MDEGKFPKCEWAMSDEERADYITIQPDKDDNPIFSFGHLEGSAKITEYIDATKSIKGFAKGMGILCMLICERHRYKMDFSITEDSYNAIQVAFKLPPKALQSFDCDAGTHSRSYTYDEAGTVNGIDFILKAPQKREVGNCGLSMHHDINTRVTTAFMFGTEMLICTDNAADLGTRHPIPAVPPVTTDTSDEKNDEKVFSYIYTRAHPNRQVSRAELRRALEASINAFKYPLALPCTILEDHIRRTQQACEHGRASEETWKIMNYIGLRGDDHNDQELFWSKAMRPEHAYSEAGEDARFQVNKLTARMDRQVLRIVYTERSPQWNLECSQFMLQVADELEKKFASDGLFKSPLHESLRASFEYNMGISTALSSRLATMKESMTLQIDILASIVDQVSNEFSARIAWDASRDSTSMKILAVITAIFLPATAVATLFSMSMFNWSWSNDSSQNNTEPGVVSHRFWIYWATAAPLTFLTLLGWGSWWIYEQYARELNYSEGGKVPWVDQTIRNLIKRRQKRKSKKAQRTTKGNEQPKEIA
ncbi:hypothetical protein NA57DRAFT_80923 [Rhizodiscina lignyota]|uniref:Uncharacterized protein n=1 Tax=Rhizodiscina lignyota TaxID=1504668 RepID=A0A9P4I5M2_9PEZI|nr:hypothetical protein NA57DRAFT_80923 [Rhizodiscina lignyota]